LKDLESGEILFPNLGDAVIGNIFWKKAYGLQFLGVRSGPIKPLRYRS